MLKSIWEYIKKHIQWPCENCCSRAKFKDARGEIVCSAVRRYCNRENKFMYFKKKS